MSHPETRSFSSEIPRDDDEAMREFQEAMNAYHDELGAYIDRLAKELGVDVACANDVYYLRTRSRWTQSLEDELIRLHKAGTPPNVCDFG